MTTLMHTTGICTTMLAVIITTPANITPRRQVSASNPDCR